MTSPFTRKLERWTMLSPADHAALESMGAPLENVERHQALIHEGDDPEHVFLLVEGWAFRYKILPDGSRQIVAFLLPGDLCDIHIFILDRMDHGISMLSAGKVVRIRKERIIHLIDEHPAIAKAFLWTTLVDEAVLREWLVNIGGRDAFPRVAHLLCELYVRLLNVGLASEGECLIPLTQIDIGEALGLTAVHVNRMLRQLRADGLASFKGKHLTIHDIDGLKTVAGFNPDYLHGKRERTAGNGVRPPEGHAAHSIHN